MIAAFPARELSLTFVLLDVFVGWAGGIGRSAAIYSGNFLH